MRSIDDVQAIVNKPFEICLQGVNMASHSGVHVQVSVYLNLPNNECNIGIHGTIHTMIA